MGRFSLLVAVGLWLALWVIVRRRWCRSRQRLARRAAGRPCARSSRAAAVLVRHDGRAPGHRDLRHRRHPRARLRDRARPAHGPGRARRRSAATSSPSRARSEVPGPNYLATRGEFEVRREGSSEPRSHRCIRRSASTRPSGQTMTEADIDTGLTRDLYVSLGEPVGDGAWGVRVYHKPFVDWIWGGCLLMALGGFLALADRRYRAAARRARPRGAEAARSARVKGCASRFRWCSSWRWWCSSPSGSSATRARFPRPSSARPRPRSRLAQLHDDKRRLLPGRHEGQGLAAQRLGVVVRVLPRRAPAAGGDGAPQGGADRRASTTRTSATTGAQWLAQVRQSLRALGLRRRGPRRHRLRRLRRAGDLRDRQGRV